MQTVNKRRLGTEYENLAGSFLAEQGYKILERNYRNRFGEIDLIAEDPDGTLVYCEIKFRSNSDAGDPLEAVNANKQRRISRTALHHYAYQGFAYNRPCRFDVIGIYSDGIIRHIKNAFDFIW